MRGVGALLNRLRGWRTEGRSDAIHPDDEWLGAAEDQAKPSRDKLLPELVQSGGHPDDWFFEPTEPAAADEHDSHPEPSENDGQAREPVDPENLPVDFGWAPPWATYQPACPEPPFPVETPTDSPAVRPDVPRITPARRAALLKAATVLDHLDIYERRQREQAHLKLAEVLEMFPRPSSFRAIAKLCIDGANVEEIQAAAELKIVWSTTPSLWLYRRHTRLRGWTVLDNYSQLRGAMTWRLSLGLSRAYPARTAEGLLGGFLLDEWSHLRPHNAFENAGTRAAFYSFPNFLCIAAAKAQCSLMSGSGIQEPDWLFEDDSDHPSSWPQNAHSSQLLRELDDVGPTIWIGRALQPSEPQ